jgi:hypothetical protein
MGHEGGASLTVYDLLGRRVRHWSWPSLPGGSHQVVWDGRADDGRPAPAGVLIYRLDAAGRTLKQKMIRLQ